MRQFPSQGAVPQQFKQLIHKLASFGTFGRTIYGPNADLGLFISNTTSLHNLFRASLQALIQWGSTSQTPTTQGPPPNYHPSLLCSALAILGTRQVLDIILEEVARGGSSMSTNGSLTVAIDVVATLVCAPFPGSSVSTSPDWTHAGPPCAARNGRISLRDALALEFNDIAALWMKDRQRAAAIVHLHRRVETHMMAVANQQHANAAAVVAEISGVVGDNGAAETMAFDAANAAAAVAAEMRVNPSVGMDMDLGPDSGLGTAMDLDLSAGADLDDLLGGSNMNFDGEEDIFAGLVGPDDLDLTSFG